MVKVSMDTSSLAKRYVQEQGSEALSLLLQDTSELSVCIITVPEIISGLNRRLREGILTTANYQRVKRQLLDDVRDATVLQITPSVISRAIKLLEKNVLRAMDALHIACAIEYQPDIFVTSDQRQYTAAGNAGLQTQYIGG